MWNKRFNKPLFWALALSLLAHVLLIGRFSGFEWPATAEQPIRVQLTPPPATLPARSQAAEKRLVPAPKPQPMNPEVAPIQAPPPAVSPAVEEAPDAVHSPMTDTPEQAAETLPPPAVEEASPLPLSPGTTMAEDAEAEQETLAQPNSGEMKPPPYFVAIDFNILRKGSVVGTEHHVYDYGDLGYTLTSIAKPKGLYALALSDLVQKSEGEVTRQGLRPKRFSYQYGKNPDKAQHAFFNWSAGKLSLQSGARKQEVPLTEGAQDMMSFMYQFMFVPPLQEMHLAITNGKRFKTYDYTFEGEETIVTPFGKVSCLHIGRTDDDGEEKTELWLATDYHYLPLKISKTEKDGTVLERVATSVQME